MPITLEISFAAPDTDLEACSALVLEAGAKLGRIGKDLDRKTDGQLSRAIAAEDFKAKRRTAVSLVAPAGTKLRRLWLVGAGDAVALAGRKQEQDREREWAYIGGYVLGHIAQAKSQSASIVLDTNDLSESAAAEAAAHLAMGALLRSYHFDTYKTKKSQPDNNGDNANTNNASTGAQKLERLVIKTPDPDAARAHFERARALAEGVALARDLVNEPANMLGPVEFAARCRQLEDVGVNVTIFDDQELANMGMHALLAVAQGSERPARVAVMEWNGMRTKPNKSTKRMCFIGKGVCFDTGGISMKPAGGMEDMKGDMGGAACVTGLMHALAVRKANVNAVGIIGLVENMPSGSATRPGDIIGSLSGQTIEVLNTDAEGRLVLADLLTYAQQNYNPAFMINLATLTGAIIVALGKDHAGMFGNDKAVDDAKLVEKLATCGKATGEKVWHMPLGEAYDKLINTPNADMKNIGGRWGGAITAAQFLNRFVDKDVPWVHLDVAGTAMASEKTEISRSWASGWGVRLLDRLVAQQSRGK